jgi:hypothetical protein
MHHKIPTTDYLASRVMQLSQNCSLCNSCPEDAHHILTECAFSKRALRHIWAWYHLHGAPPQDARVNAAWITSSAAAGGVSQVRRSTCILLYCWWNILKSGIGGFSTPCKRMNCKLLYPQRRRSNSTVELSMNRSISPLAPLLSCSFSFLFLLQAMPPSVCCCRSSGLEPAGPAVSAQEKLLVAGWCGWRLSP